MAVQKTKLDKLCTRIADLKIEKARLDAEASKCSKELEELYLKVTPLLEDTDQKSWHVKGVGTFGPTWDTYFSIVDQERLQGVLKARKLTSLIKVSSTVIKTWAKDELEKMKAEDKDLAIDSSKLQVKVAQEFGLTFYEKARIGFTKKEGKYQTTDKEE